MYTVHLEVWQGEELMSLAVDRKKAMKLASALPLDNDAGQHPPERQRRGTITKTHRCPRLRGLHAMGNAWLGVSPKEQLVVSPSQ